MLVYFYMDPVNPIAGNPEAVNQTPVTPQVPVEAPKPEVKSGGNSIMIVAVALFILATLSIVAFLYYQNQQLKSMLTSYQTPSGSPTPVATVDSTADWKIYSDKKEGIEFKYPNNWYAVPYEFSTFNVFLDSKPFKIPEASSLITPIQVSYNEATNTTTNKKFYEEKTLAEGITRFKSLFVGTSIKIDENLLVGGKQAVKISGNLGPGMMEGQYFEYTLVQLTDKLLVIQMSGVDNQQIYNQILSTFKFQELTPSASPAVTY